MELRGEGFAYDKIINEVISRRRISFENLDHYHLDIKYCLEMRFKQNYYKIYAIKLREKEKEHEIKRSNAFPYINN